jgi:hypothetical protein
MTITKAGRLSKTTYRWVPWLCIAAAAFAVEIPFFFLGTPSGHDVEFHLYSWLEVVAQWKQGIFYPRWAGLAQFGYGEPRFIFYPPGSWMLGGMLSAIFPWTLASEIYIWVALMAAGGSMFGLARRWMDRRDATFAAVLYAVNPYHLVIVYWRSAFGELLAASLVPLLLLVVLRIGEGKQRGTGLIGEVVPLGLVLAGAWLVNAPAAVMIHYSMALLIVVVAWQRRSARVLAVGMGAAILGAGLAAFYLFPAMYEQKWVSIGQAVGVGSRPLDNFLFVRTADAEHDAFNRVVSWVAVGEIALTIAAAWAARSWGSGNRRLWYLLAGWAAVCMMLMLPASNLLWEILPKLRFMQFPWRWTLCLGVPFTLFVTFGVRRWQARAAVYLATLCVLGFAWHHFQSPWWDTRGDLREMQDNMESGAGYEGTEEYTPAEAEGASVDQGAPQVRVQGAARTAIRVTRWAAERKEFTADVSAPDTLVVRLLNYPAWRVEVNGRAVTAATQEGTGAMEIPVGAGANLVRIVLVRTWDRTVGGWISVATIFLVLILWRTVRDGGVGIL